MYTQEQFDQMVATKRAEIEALVAQGIVAADMVEPSVALYIAQLQQAQQVQQPVQPGHVVLEDGEEVTIIPVEVEDGETDAKTKLGEKVVNMFKSKKPTRFEYKEITDLYMPKLNEENKRKAVALANDIEMLRVSIHQRTEDGIVVPDAEIDSLNNMKKAFKKLTRTDYYTAITSMATKGKDKAVDWTDALATDMESRSTQLISDLEEVACETIAQAESLATLTVGFTSNLAQGSVKLAGATSRGLIKAGLGVFKKRAK